MTGEKSEKMAEKSQSGSNLEPSSINDAPTNDMSKSGKNTSKNNPEYQNVNAQKDKTNILVLDSELNIAATADLYDRMQPFLDQKEEILLDASKVEVVDSAALQLLLVFVREAQERSISTRWESASKKFLNTVTLLGFQQHLGV